MPPQKHIIGREIFQIKVTDKTSAGEIQQIVSELANHRFKEFLAEILDRFDFGDQTIRIDKIAIDLGKVTKENFSEKLLYHTELIFEQIFQGIASKKPIYPKRSIAILDFFLNKGYLPWWVAHPEPDFLDQTLSEALKKHPKELLKTLQPLRLKSSVAKRLVDQFSSDLLFQLAQILWPGTLKRQVGFLDTLWALTMQGIWETDTSSKTSFTTHLFRFLWTENGSIHQDKFLRSYIDALAIETKFSEQEIGHRLMNAANSVQFSKSSGQLISSLEKSLSKTTNRRGRDQFPGLRHFFETGQFLPFSIFKEKETLLKWLRQGDYSSPPLLSHQLKDVFKGTISEASLNQLEVESLSSLAAHILGPQFHEHEKYQEDWSYIFKAIDTAGLSFSEFRRFYFTSLLQASSHRRQAPSFTTHFFAAFARHIQMEEGLLLQMALAVVRSPDRPVFKSILPEILEQQSKETTPTPTAYPNKLGIQSLLDFLSTGTFRPTREYRHFADLEIEVQWWLTDRIETFQEVLRSMWLKTGFHTAAVTKFKATTLSLLGSFLWDRDWNKVLELEEVLHGVIKKRHHHIVGRKVRELALVHRPATTSSLSRFVQLLTQSISVLSTVSGQSHQQLFSSLEKELPDGWKMVLAQVLPTEKSKTVSAFQQTTEKTQQIANFLRSGKFQRSEAFPKFQHLLNWMSDSTHEDQVNQLLETLRSQGAFSSEAVQLLPISFLKYWVQKEWGKELLKKWPSVFKPLTNKGLSGRTLDRTILETALSSDKSKTSEQQLLFLIAQYLLPPFSQKLDVKDQQTIIKSFEKQGLPPKQMEILFPSPQERTQQLRGDSNQEIYLDFVRAFFQYGTWSEEEEDQFFLQLDRALLWLAERRDPELQQLLFSEWHDVKRQEEYIPRLSQEAMIAIIELLAGEQRQIFRVILKDLQLLAFDLNVEDLDFNVLEIQSKGLLVKYLLRHSEFQTTVYLEGILDIVQEMTALSKKEIRTAYEQAARRLRASESLDSDLTDLLLLSGSTAIPSIPNEESIALEGITYFLLTGSFSKDTAIDSPEDAEKALVKLLKNHPDHTEDFLRDIGAQAIVIDRMVTYFKPSTIGSILELLSRGALPFFRQLITEFQLLYDSKGKGKTPSISELQRIIQTHLLGRLLRQSYAKLELKEEIVRLIVTIGNDDEKASEEIKPRLAIVLSRKDLSIYFRSAAEQLERQLSPEEETVIRTDFDESLKTYQEQSQLAKSMQALADHVERSTSLKGAQPAFWTQDLDAIISALKKGQNNQSPANIAKEWSFILPKGIQQRGFFKVLSDHQTIELLAPLSGVYAEIIQDFLTAIRKGEQSPVLKDKIPKWLIRQSIFDYVIRAEKMGTEELVETVIQAVHLHSGISLTTTASAFLTAVETLSKDNELRYYRLKEILEETVKTSSTPSPLSQDPSTFSNIRIYLEKELGNMAEEASVDLPFFTLIEQLLKKQEQLSEEQIRGEWELFWRTEYLRDSFAHQITEEHLTQLLSSFDKRNAALLPTTLQVFKGVFQKETIAVHQHRLILDHFLLQSDVSPATLVKDAIEILALDFGKEEQIFTELFYEEVQSLDLSDTPSETSWRELLQNLEKNKQASVQKKESIPSSNTVADLLSALRHYFLYGSFRANHPILSKKEWETEQIRLIDQHPNLLGTFYREILKEEGTSDRLLRQFSSKIVYRVVDLLAPGQSGLLRNIWNDLAQLIPENRISRSDFEAFAHSFSLNYFANASGTGIDIQEYFYQLLNAVSSKINRGIIQLYVDLEEEIQKTNLDLSPHFMRMFTAVLAKLKIKDEMRKNIISARSEKKKPLGDTPLEEGVFIANAGLVIIAPFLTRYFSMVGLTEGKDFRDEEAATRGAVLLHYLATGLSGGPEYSMTLNKILCGLPLHWPLPNSIELLENEKEGANSLLNAVLSNWSKLENSSIETLQQTFLQREGRLREEADRWELIVESKAFDIILEYIPWTIGMIKLPWMKKRIEVTWKTRL